MHGLQIRKLVLDNGDVPFDLWLEGLRDLRLQAAVASRLARVRAGNLGDFKPLGRGVGELRIDKGPGLRVYFGRQGNTIIVLIGGGDKRTQSRDIWLAKKLWKEFVHATQRLPNRSHPEAEGS
jgi:putative addiction module killer protein